MSTVPTLVAPAKGEELDLYLVVFKVADDKTRNVMMEKMVLALVTTKKKLRHYFESHTIMVVSNCPIRQVLSKPDLSGRLNK